MGQCTSSQNGVEKKLLTSMTNSTTTGTSDQSSSSLRQGYRNGNSGSVGYGFSTTKSSTIGLVGLNNIGNTCFMYLYSYLGIQYYSVYLIYLVLMNTF